MAYADYIYYLSKYGGDELGEVAFRQASREASAYIDRVTFGRIGPGSETPDEVKRAVCAASEVIARKNQERIQKPTGIKSESVGKHSVSYSDGETKDYLNELTRCVDLYLPRSHPLRFAGVRE